MDGRSARGWTQLSRRIKAGRADRRAAARTAAQSRPMAQAYRWRRDRRVMEVMRLSGCEILHMQVEGGWPRPRHQTRIAFCTCRRFSASSKTDGLRPVDHLVGDLLAAMGRQAMHEDRILGRASPSARGRPDRACSRLWRRLAVLVAHRHPGIGDDAVRACRPPRRDRSSRVTLGACAFGPFAQRRRRRERLGRRDPQCEVEARRRMDPGGAAHCWRRRSRPPCLPRIGPFFSSKVMTSAITWQGCEQLGQAVDHRHGRRSPPAPSACRDRACGS